MIFLSENPEGNWPEDFPLENGNYLCRCLVCEKTFIGYKRRAQCKVCHDKEKTKWESLSPEQQAKENFRAQNRFLEYIETLKKNN